MPVATASCSAATRPGRSTKPTCAGSPCRTDHSLRATWSSFGPVRLPNHCTDATGRSGASIGLVTDVALGAPAAIRATSWRAASTRS